MCVRACALCVYACVRVCACARVRVCACARVRVCACARVRVCACARVRVCACARVCVCSCESRCFLDIVFSIFLYNFHMIVYLILSVLKYAFSFAYDKWKFVGTYPMRTFCEFKISTNCETSEVFK